MERMNDAMTICTLARPDVVTLKTNEYIDLIKAQEQCERLIEAITQAISLDHHGSPQIDYKGDDLIMFAFRLLEPEAYNYRIRQLKKGEDDDSMD